MASDKAEWHYGGDFPEDLPIENGGTHIAMYLTWIFNNDLFDEEIIKEYELLNEVDNLKNRSITGNTFLFDFLDEVFADEILNDEGTEFTEFYYEGDYFEDYENVLAENLPSIYHVEDTWENYDKIAQVIDKRFSEWKNSL